MAMFGNTSWNGAKTDKVAKIDKEIAQTGKVAGYLKCLVKIIV